MELEDLLIKKEEIPIEIVPSGMGPKPYFMLPIHPVFKDETKNFDKTLASKLFPEVIDDWYSELTSYVNGLEKESEKKWYREIWLNEKPKIREKYGHQYLGDHDWKDEHGFMENGFTFYFSLERNMAGSIGVHFADWEGARTYIGPRKVNFSPEKFAEYKSDRDVNKKVTKKEIEDAKDGVYAYTYHHHNVELYASALFMRNWAIMYENESLKQIYKK